MGDIFYWLAGANRRLLAKCPTERPKYFGLGAVIVVTGAMAGVSLAFALVNALSISTQYAIIFGVFWGVAIIMIDRLFVASMHRQRNPLFYIFQALPRLAMSLVLGLVISTPFVLQIFKPEINSEIQQMQAAQRETYFRNLRTNPVNLAVKQDQTEVTNLSALAASGGSGINLSKDPQLVSLNSQLANAQSQLARYQNDLSCQLYGIGSKGQKCKPGYGPLGQDDQAQITYYSAQVSTLSGEITKRTDTLDAQSAAQQKSQEKTYKSQLNAAEQALQTAQQQLTLQTANVTSGIKQNHGILAQLQALGNVTAGNSTLQWARLLLFLLFLFIDIMPVFMKLLINLMPASTYDAILAEEEGLEARDAEDDRAQRQHERRAARHAEAAGVRARNEAYFAALPGMTDEIIAARLRVEKHWLKRREEAMMRDVSAGAGIVGIGVPPSVVPGPSGWPKPAGWPKPRPALKSPWRREPAAPGDLLRDAPRRRAEPAWLPAWLAVRLPARRRAARGLRRRSGPGVWRRAPGPDHAYAPFPEDGPPAPDGHAAGWDDTRRMREFKRAPYAPDGEPADLDEPADFMGAPEPDYPDGPVLDGHDGYVPDGHDGYAPDGHDGYVPDGHDGYAPDGHDGYAPDGHDGYAPDGHDGYAPDGHDGYA
ncbi:MAG: DUF4407 domain-containing protein, partial [Streptosporangiaceae bacterium]